MRINKRTVAACLLVLSGGISCAGEIGDESEETGVDLASASLDDSEVGLTADALRVGTWVDMSNGEAPTDGVNISGLYVCAALHGDGVYHPGKVYSGHCYYGWDGREYARRTYKALRRRASYVWQRNTGATPSNAVAGPVVSGVATLAVCTVGQAPNVAHGKVWNGQCHYGWSGREDRTTNFRFLVDTAAR
jgi:hypothetical protein